MKAIFNACSEEEKQKKLHLYESEIAAGVKWFMDHYDANHDATISYDEFFAGVCKKNNIWSFSHPLKSPKWLKYPYMKTYIFMY